MSSTTYTATQVLSSPYLFNRLVTLLDLSFSTDPMPNWLFNQETHSEFIRKLTHYHRFLLRTALHSGATVTVIEDDDSAPEKASPGTTPFRAIAVLIPPSGNKTWESFSTLLRSGLIPLIYNTGFTPMKRMIYGLAPRLTKMSESIYPPPNQKARCENWHLLFLAVRPDSQGRGLGGRLVRGCQGVVREARVEGRVGGMYLEPSTVGSKSLYERCGFVEKASMVYGQGIDGEVISVDGEGKILGGMLWGMVWMP